MEISIVIPAYNEKMRLTSTMRTTLKYFDRRGFPYEIILVNDGSSDGTLELAKALASSRRNVYILSYDKNMGKGYALRRGFAASRGRLVLIMDADMSTKLSCVEGMLRKINNGADIVIGSRSNADSIIRTVYSRKLFGYLFSLCVRLLLGVGFVDTQCGFKLIRRSALKSLGTLKENRFLFDVELLYYAKERGYRIVESPVVWVHSKDSKVSIFKDAPSMLVSLIKFWLSKK